MCSLCQSNPTDPDGAVNHMQTHNIYLYHCRYCTFGALTTDEVYKHLSHQHFALSPKIVIRQFVYDGSGVTIYLEIVNQYSTYNFFSTERLG